MTADSLPVNMLKIAHAQGAFSAAQLVVQSPSFSLDYCTGQHLNELPVTSASLFDIASLTKLLATTALTAQAIANGQLSLQTSVRTVLPNCAGHKETTVEDLLAHRSGLPPWRPLYKSALEVAGGVFSQESARISPPAHETFIDARRRTLTSALKIQPNQPIGIRQYSDVGFILLGALLERTLSAPLDALYADLAKRIGLGDTGYQDLGTVASSSAQPFVVTGDQRPRPVVEGIKKHYVAGQTKTQLRLGEVDDDNAYALGGVAGHAGLFSTAQDVARFGTWLIHTLGQDTPLGKVWRQFVIPDDSAKGAARGLGVDLPSRTGSSIGNKLGSKGPHGAIGHLGFTGCSLWVDLDRQASVALLTNRVWSDRQQNPVFRTLRPALHDVIADLIDAQS